MKKVLVSVFGLLFVVVAGVLIWKVAMPAGTVVGTAVATDILLEPTKLVVSQGQATVSRTNATPIKVTTELEVKEGDAIQVDAAGKASITWSDGSITRLAGGTDMTITKAVIDAASGEQEVQVDVRSGQVWSKVLNVVQDNSSMQVRAQNTVAGIRGTSLYTSVSSTGIVMMPFEHGVEMTMEGTEMRTTLISGEGAVVRGSTMTKVGTGSVMNGFVTESEEEDEAYLARIAEERRLEFLEKMPKDAKALPEPDSFIESFKAQQGTSAEKSNKLGGLIDQVVAEMIAAQNAGDAVRLADLSEYYENMIPLMQEAAQGDLETRDALRQRVQLHMAVLFSNGMTDDDFFTRQAVAKARFALLDPNDDARLRRVLRKELFLIADLAEAGKDRQVQEMMSMLRDADVFQKPLMDGATDMDKEMFEKIGSRLAASMPTSSDGMEALRKQLYSQKVETTNSNQNTNDNMNTEPEIEEPVAPVTNTNAARRTNTNTNTRTTTTPKPATTTTTPKPTPTPTPAPATTTPAVTAPAATNTLIPAPVRTDPARTSRPVLTPAR